jgi:hypothetical protein
MVKKNVHDAVPSLGRLEGKNVENEVAGAF